MIAFITTVRHPSTANNFARVESLLELSLKSVCRQSDGDFRVVVVCNQKPRIAFEDPRIVYHTVDFPPPTASKTSETIATLHRDKGTKLLSGLLLARDFQPTHAFFFDADDLVSRRVAQYINAHPDRSWYVDAGYVINYRTMRMQRKYGLVRYCGSTLAPRLNELLRVGEVAASLSPQSSQEQLSASTAPTFIQRYLGDHPHTVPHLIANGEKVGALPFPAIAWVLDTGENYSVVRGRPEGVPLSRSFVDEFGIGAEEEKSVGTPSDYLREARSMVVSRIGSLSFRWSQRPRRRLSEA